jgi:minor extracellular serine protease Vpr
MSDLVRFGALLFLFSFLCAAEVVPGRYFVELSGPPASAGGGRAQVSSEQAGVRRMLAGRRVRVLNSVDTVANVLTVDVADDEASSLALLPGVKRVEQVRELKLTLDRAVQIHQILPVWDALGGTSKAGEGVRIAILDSGIDSQQPGFRDVGFLAPDGFPRMSREEDRRLTNNKVIVVRVYEGPLVSGEDQFGHGTAVAMAAAGVTSDSPVGALTGVAPRAWIGCYKVTRSDTGSIYEDSVLQALNDAMNDGMNVINMSFGAPGLKHAEDSVLSQALLRTIRSGITVVQSAGNEGPDPMTVDGNSSLGEMIAVGANDNDRARVSPSVSLENQTGLMDTEPGQNSAAPGPPPVTATIVDVQKLDPTGLACGPLPAESLTGRIALIERGTCPFEDKLNNAQAAGAAAAIVYAPPDRPTEWALMQTGGATLPSAFILYSSAQRIRLWLADGDQQKATIRFYQVPLNPGHVSDYSSRGPSVDIGIKPDLTATGTPLITATQSVNPFGELYASSGWLQLSGTSFSAPLISGAAALLKQARPGLSEADYRSLLINSTDALPGASVQTAGAGRLNVLSAVRSTIVAAPVSLSFGAGGSTVEMAKDVTLKNLGGSADNYTLSIESADAVKPEPRTQSMSVEAGGSAAVTVTLKGVDLPAGAYQGFIVVRGETAPVSARIPYFYEVKGASPAKVSVAAAPSAPQAGTNFLVLFRVFDAGNVPLTSVTPEVVAVEGGGSVVSVQRAPDQYPDMWYAELKTGPIGGVINLFQFKAGDVVYQWAVQSTIPGNAP